MSGLPVLLALPELEESGYQGTVNNRHFGARPTVSYSGGVLYWGIIVEISYFTLIAGYRLYGLLKYISRLCEYIQSLVDRENL